MHERTVVVRKFRNILPGVGRRVAQDLYELGYRDISEFNGAEPEMMYERLCARAGKHLDRCLLYTFRCVVYFASNKKHDQEKLKWWYWKDGVK